MQDQKLFDSALIFYKKAIAIAEKLGIKSTLAFGNGGIGRVILNILNNAFYAVGEKKKTAGQGYEPTVLIATKKADSKIEIHVQDNGTGIPQRVIDKIFQPFFTTKPSGEGTGLGLSLSYDSIKAHGGQLKVETTEG